MNTIPIIHCFDHNYILPAAVCFRSLLEHAQTPETSYELVVVGDNLTADDRELLVRVVAPFPQARLRFRTLVRPEIPTCATPGKTHFSPALFYKLVLAKAMTEYDKAIVADVDVVYEDDIASLWPLLSADEPYELAGVWDVAYASAHGKGLFPVGKPLMRHYRKFYTASERAMLRIGAGLLLCNFRKLRESGRCDEWINYACANAHRAILPEQECFGLVRGDLIKLLPLRFMAIAEHAEKYDAMTVTEREANPSWDEMYAHPVQMHYATKVKPWNDPGSPRAELWFAALARAGLLELWRRWYANWSKGMITDARRKRLVSLNLGRFELQVTKKPKQRKR